MKASTIFVSALASLAVAAPTSSTEVEKRAFTGFDIGQFNQFQKFGQVNFDYLLNINALQIDLLNGLANINNFNVLQFQGLFNAQAFDIAHLLQLQSLQTFLQIHQLGVLDVFDLGALNLQFLDLGVINNIGGVDLGQFINPNVFGQIESVANQGFFVKE